MCCRPARKNVGISGIEPVGNYALRLLFNDGHNTGLYSWSLLHELGRDSAPIGHVISNAAPRPASGAKPAPDGSQGPPTVRTLRSATMTLHIEERHEQRRTVTVDFGYEKVGKVDKAARVRSVFASVAESTTS